MHTSIQRNVSTTLYKLADNCIYNVFKGVEINSEIYVFSLENHNVMYAINVVRDNLANADGS